MRAMVFERVGEPLRAVELEVPSPGPGELLLRVHACGVCRTDLHLLDGEVEVEQPPRVLGHQIIGTVEALGAETPARAADRPGGGDGAAHDPSEPAAPAKVGDRVGVPWLGWSCGECKWCLSGRENLCPRARFTGCDIDGGMAEYAVADARFCFPIPQGYPDDQAAPLMCAGLIGYRALRMCGEAQRIGLYGFGASAHILVQVCVSQGREVYAFTRAGDDAAQAFARELGAVWAGNSQQQPPQPLDAAIVFAPDGALVPLALGAVAPAGVVVCGGIHMSDIPSFPYSALWQERIVRSVANLTRTDGYEFLELAPQVPVKTRVGRYALEDANEALADLRAGRFTGAAVIVP
ncbi:MAG TPA: zinc-dependent alcohol dehydrogenase family protein [Solirubrobacteraceae bacterium]|jgi:propanol-preferring alcohol dehydrogenase|nr:zinc-dependent alcohol dehydrogenase family protein [Solirubrobacteraceae bacterium]